MVSLGVLDVIMFEEKKQFTTVSQHAIMYFLSFEGALLCLRL